MLTSVHPGHSSQCTRASQNEALNKKASAISRLALGKNPIFFPFLFSGSSSTLWQIQCQTALAHRLWPAPSPAQHSSKFRERSSWNIQTQRHPHANTHCSVHSSPQAELVEPGFLLLSNIQQPHKGRTDCSLLLQQCYPRFYSFVIRFVGT